MTNYSTLVIFKQLIIVWKFTDNTLIMKTFDPFLYNDWEIKQTLSVLLELIKFNKHTIEFF